MTNTYTLFRGSEQLFFKMFGVEKILVGMIGPQKLENLRTFFSSGN